MTSPPPTAPESPSSSADRPSRHLTARPARRVRPGAVVWSMPAFTCTPDCATRELASLDPLRTQEASCSEAWSVGRKSTRFGRDHAFERIRTVADFQSAVPLRTYEALWNDYLRDRYPVFENLTWPGRIPFLALTSGTTQGATKYIPVSREMVASNRKAAQTMVAYHLAARPASRLFHGRLFFLGGTANLEEPAPGVRQGDLSGIAALELSALLRPYTFPPLELALESNWDRKLGLLAEESLRQRITLVSGVPSWLLMLFQRILELSGKSQIGEVWPELEIVVHGGVKFDPYEKAFQQILGSDEIRLQETYPCSEGFIAFGDPRTGLLRLLLDHGLFYEFVPVDELDSPAPTRHWLGTVDPGVNYAIVVSTCAGMWAHVIGDTVRFESLDPPLDRVHRPNPVHALGIRRAPDQRGDRGSDGLGRDRSAASVRDWHVGPVFEGALGYHQYVIEFLETPADPGPVPASSWMTTCPGATPTTWLIGRRAWVCPCPPWSWPGRGRSTPGCARGASSGARTRCPAWTDRER